MMRTQFGKSTKTLRFDNGGNVNTGCIVNTAEDRKGCGALLAAQEITWA